MPSKGKTTERGYGAAHQRLRKRLLPLAYFKPCPKCGETMYPEQALDLGHTDDRKSYTGIEHAVCNRRDGAIRGNAARENKGYPHQSKSSGDTNTGKTVRVDISGI